MSEDRLARIEAVLDNQVAVNAELRTSTQQLRATAQALLSTVQIHQQNFEILTAQINTLAQSQIQNNARLEEYQRTTNAALERIDAMLDYLIRQQAKQLSIL